MNLAHYRQPARATPVPRVRGRILAALTLGAALAGCAGDGGHRGLSSGSPREYAPATAASARSNQVLMRAIGLVGTPYRYGGNTPGGGFDCSGLVGFVFNDAAGLRLPRSTRELVEIDAPRVRRDRLAPGDLVFFNPGGGTASHIGIYVGENRFVHAPSAGGTVRLDVLTSAYWDRAYSGAKRVLR